jgi:hypothetical protein
MEQKTKNILKSLIFLFLIYIALLPRHYAFFPTMPIYDNTEASAVAELIKTRKKEDIDFFNLTNESVSSAFLPHIKESRTEIDDIIEWKSIEILIFKFIINRARPYQIDNTINYIYTNTGLSPSMPAGHAYQAYYLSKILSKRYPEKKEIFERIAKKCDDTRVLAGIHYPSDGKMSKCLVDILYN